jgi:hypothetical protein
MVKNANSSELERDEFAPPGHGQNRRVCKMQHEFVAFLVFGTAKERKEASERISLAVCPTFLFGGIPMSWSLGSLIGIPAGGLIC